jgi:hypothetical protein
MVLMLVLFAHLLGWKAFCGLRREEVIRLLFVGGERAAFEGGFGMLGLLIV